MRFSRHRICLLAVALAASWIAMLALSCLIGPMSISPLEILRVLGQMAGLESSPDNTAWLVITHLRLARSILALLCGGALAAAGVALQGALRNPLADPFTLGISAGAACGASIAIVFCGFAPSLPQTFFVSLAALAGAFAAMICALALGRGAGAYGRESVILAGIAVAAFLGAIVALIKALNEDSVTSIVFWMLGSLQGRGWNSLPIIFATLPPGLVIICLAWRKLDVMSLGDEEAAHLGLRPGSARLAILAGASCMTAGCVAVCGVIGFVGLVVPHIFRLILGGEHGSLLLSSFFGGGIFLLIADCIARIVLDGGQELPVGVVTALAGAPFFAFLIWQRRP